MRKKNLGCAFVVFLCLLMLLILASCNKAVANEIAASENQKTEIATWFENNLGWFIGIPSGVFLASILELLGLFSKKKDYAKDMFQNSLMREYVHKEISKVAETNVKFGQFVTETQNRLIETDKKIDEVIEKAEAQASKYEEIVNANLQLESKINTLIVALALMSSQDKDLVANGVAEKINKLIDNE